MDNIDSFLTLALARKFKKRLEHVWLLVQPVYSTFNCLHCGLLLPNSQLELLGEFARSLLLGTVNHLLNRHLWTGTNCPSYRESNKGSKERQEQTLGVRFTD